MASGERPAGRAPDRKDVGTTPLKPKATATINPRMAKRIDDVEDAQDAAEFVEDLKNVRDRTREQYDRQVKSVWPVIERAKKVARDTAYPNSLEAGAVEFHIRHSENQSMPWHTYRPSRGRDLLLCQTLDQQFHQPPVDC